MSRRIERVDDGRQRLLAAERGIEIVEQASTEKGDFRTLLGADVQTDKKTYHAAATLFGNQFLLAFGSDRHSVIIQFQS